MCTAAMVDRFLASKCTCRLYMVFVVNLKCNERRALKYIDQSQEWVFQEMWWWWRSGSTMKKYKYSSMCCRNWNWIFAEQISTWFRIALYTNFLSFDFLLNFHEFHQRERWNWKCIKSRTKRIHSFVVLLLYTKHKHFLAQPVIHQL